MARLRKAYWQRPQTSGGGTSSGLLAYTKARRADSVFFIRGAHWKFDEGAGATAADSSGNGNDLTLNAPYAWIAGGAPNGYPSLKIHNGFLTNNLTTSQSADIALSFYTNGSLVANIGWTAFFRIKCSPVASNGNQFEAIKQLQPATFNSGSWICAVYGNAVGANAGKFAIYASGGASLYYSAARIDDGLWHDIVVIKDFSRTNGDVLRIYVDGSLSASYTALFANTDQTSHQFAIKNGATGAETPEISEVAFLPFAIPSTVPALLWNGGGGNQRRLDDLNTGLIELARA